YGLEPGIYHVASGGRSPIPSKPGPYDKDAMTYYPSGTADTAADVALRAGEEVTGIDIRYRGTAGYSISGSISAAPDFLQGGVFVMLTHGPSGSLLGTIFVVPGNQSRGFIFDGIGDGDYYVTAYANSVMREGEVASASPRRISVKGGDVTGANLTLTPLGTIKGHVVIERSLGADLKQNCGEHPAPQLREVVVSVRSGNRNRPEREYLSLLDGFLSTSLSEGGEVLIRHTDAGQHFIVIDLPAGPLYVKAISLPVATPGAAKIDAARNGINLKAGGRLDGLVITLAEGAARLAGKVAPAKEGSALPARMRVHLVPAEQESAEETLRYAEVLTGADESFEFFNIAPGRYWVVVRAVPEEESPEVAPRPLAWDASGRAGLRFEGEAINAVVELKPCSHLAAFTVRYNPPMTRPSKRQERD
ncbi:MAG TPA: hypothetical protein VLD57_11420, partial [Blastocatellia bacterium]|nr:hypothetical protein [Blastocatellia bacterium]